MENSKDADSNKQHNRLLGLMGSIKQHHAPRANPTDVPPEPELKITLTLENSFIMPDVLTITEPGTFLFGRAKDAFLVLPQGDRFASRNHFVLIVSQQDCRLIDLDSSNGTFVGSLRYGGNTPLPPGTTKAPKDVREKEVVTGDIIQAGETKIRIEISCSARATLTAKTRILFTDDRFGSECVEATMPHPVGSKPTRPQPPTAWFPPREQLRKAREESKHFNPPCNLKGYRFERLVGKGRMGYVFKAVHLASGLPVAVKVIAVRNRPLDGELILAFQKELEVQAQLNHPNIVKFLSVRDAEQPCLLFEYVEGIDLARFLGARGGRLLLEEAGPLMIDILSGLACAHAFSWQSCSNVDSTIPSTLDGIVHRDLKPENILLTHNGDRWVAKVTDFGLVKSFESLGITGNTTGELMAGPPNYWPRELITGYRYLLSASDVFSAAAIFFQMLTGESVRQGFSELPGSGEQNEKPDALDYVKVIMNESTRPIQSACHDLPAKLCGVINRALSERELPKDPIRMRKQLNAMRFPHAGAFLEALTEVGLPEMD